MPTAYLKKLAKLNKVSVNKIEKFWSQAKEIAKSEGNGKAWGLITTIFQNKLKKEGYKVKAFTSLADTEKLLTKESSKALLAMLKHSYFKNVRDDIKQIWARSRNSEDTANEWLLKYQPLIVECEKLAIEPKVCARMCYIKYHKENPYTKHLNKNNDVSLTTLKKEALQYFEGLKKWKEDNKEFNKETEEFMKNEKVTAGVENKYSYKGKIITASSKQEAIKKIVAMPKPGLYRLDKKDIAELKPILEKYKLVLRDNYLIFKDKKEVGLICYRKFDNKYLVYKKDKNKKIVFPKISEKIAKLLVD